LVLEKVLLVVAVICDVGTWVCGYQQSPRHEKAAVFITNGLVLLSTGCFCVALSWDMYSIQIGWTGIVLIDIQNLLSMVRMPSTRISIRRESMFTARVKHAARRSELRHIFRTRVKQNMQRVPESQAVEVIQQEDLPLI